MLKGLLAAAAVAGVLLFGLPGDRAAAMTVASPAALGAAAVEQSQVQQVHWGWHHGWHRGWGWHHRWWGWHRHYWGGWHRHYWWHRPYWGWRHYYWGGPYWGHQWGWGWGWHRYWW
jgi:hypothetical protein